MHVKLLKKHQQARPQTDEQAKKGDHQVPFRNAASQEPGEYKWLKA